MHTYTRVHISLLCELCGSLRLDLWHVIACIDLLFAGEEGEGEKLRSPKCVLCTVLDN